MSFAAVIGHARQIETLRRLHGADRLAHALLFAGPPGVGKRLVADALAAFVLCETVGPSHPAWREPPPGMGSLPGRTRAAPGARPDVASPGPSADACGACDSCRQFAAGSHPDATLISLSKGKREIPIDRVRELNQFLRLQPIRAGRKVAILDDAHLLNLAAQNALLKGLEEPPADSLLLLVAHNPDALLPTVRSRCQRLLFAPLADDDVRRVLTERLAIPRDEAERLLAVADGSPGRALRQRAVLTGDLHATLTRLAALERARYGFAVQTATELSGSDDSAATGLEWVLRSLCRRAASASRAGNLDEAAATARQAGLVSEALGTMQRRNVNRQLLLEALLLRLGDG